jgi:hypothetical protein
LRLLRTKSDKSIKIKAKDIDQLIEKEPVPAPSKLTIHDAIKSMREIDKEIEKLVFQNKVSTSARRNRHGIKF